MAYRKNQTNAQIVPLAMMGIEGETTTGNMSTNAYRAGFTRYGAPYHGSLPRVWRAWLDSRFNAGAITQVIYSYSTPIAWFDVNYGWIIPIVSYSVTTSGKHQSQLYRLRGRRIYMPWDATPEDAQRVMDGKMVFNGDRGTLPGPNYQPETTATKVTARDSSGIVYSCTKVS